MPRKIIISITFIALCIFIYAAYSAFTRYQSLREARKTVETILKDPASAQYSNETVSKDGAVVCGEVNSKNSLGGYVGFKRYLTRGKEVLIDGHTFDNWRLAGGKTKPTKDETMMLEYTERPAIGAGVTESGILLARRDLFNWVWKTSCNQT